MPLISNDLIRNGFREHTGQFKQRGKRWGKESKERGGAWSRLQTTVISVAPRVPDRMTRLYSLYPFHLKPFSPSLLLLPSLLFLMDFAWHFHKNPIIKPDYQRIYFPFIKFSQPPKKFFLS